MSLLDTIKAQPPKKLALIGGGAVAAIVLVGGGALALTGGGGDDETATSTTTSSTEQPPPTATSPEPAPVPETLMPLTGLPAGDDEEHMERSALVVKIDNVEPAARPQVGLNQADVVYEERVEGSVTRLLAIFHSDDAEGVGPIRSARSSDLGILSMLNRPYFAWSGANPTFAQAVRASNVVDVGVEQYPDQYFRASDRAAPSNLMASSTTDLLELAGEGTAAPQPLFEYRGEGDEAKGVEDVDHVRITFGTSAGSAPVEYEWTGEGWARSQAGTPHVDASGERVTPENVIVQFTPYADTAVNDQFGTPSREAQLVGEGDAWVLTDGGLIEARWKKESLDAVTEYTDANGDPIQLTPGQTWVELPEPGGAEQL